jgi:hypothetical protein
VTGSYIYATSSSTNIMSVLTQTSLDAATAASSKRFQLLSTLLQNQFSAKAAALTAEGQPTASENFLQVEISGLSQQKAIFSKLQNQYGANIPLLGDLSAQLTSAQTAAQNGDSAGFDAFLAAANTDIAGLTVVQANGVLQNDGVTPLKLNGLGVKSSATYDLTTAAGQAAALADLTTAQQLVGQVASQTTINQIIAGGKSSALSSQSDSLNNTLQNDKFARQAQAATQTLTLKNQLNTQLHLVELQFSNSQAAAKSLETQQQNLQSVLAAPAPGTTLSIFA